ncbi:hypothetical protein Tco_0007434 [Tanacetum coccineum]
MELENTQNNALAKLPMLKLGEYEMWEIRIKQYFQIQDYALWEVIENGNSWVPIPVTAPETGPSTATKMTVPSTAEEKTCKKNDVKARSLLLMALPNEHQLTFDQYVDAQSMFAAIKARFGGNEATKKTQKALLKQQYENFNASSSESLDSIFNRLQKLVSRLAILVWMNKPDFDTMGLDDLYNNFKIVEQKVKKSVGTNNDDKNLAFLTTSGASSTNNINTVNPEVSTGTTKVNTASTEISTASFSDATVYAFLSTQPQGSQLVHEDLEQLHDDDLEEMDLKWNMALLSMRARKFYQRTGRKIIIDGSNTAGFFMINQKSDNSKENTDDSLKQQQKTDSKTSSVKSPLKVDKDWKEKFFCPANHVREEEPKKARENNDAPIIEDWVSDDEDDDEPIPKVEKKTVIPTATKKEFVKPEKPVRRSVSCPKTSHPSAHKHMAPKAVLMKTGLKSVNTARPVNTVRSVNTGRPFSTARSFNTVRPSYTAHPKSISNSQLNDKGFVDSGCSRHMTGNIAHLLDFKDFDGGYVTFGGGAYGGRITGKGTIKTDNLDFDDVYFVKELKFNLFSVSQMCDKKNYVLFTDSECLVLSPNFKLPDENQILLKIPRQDNMYSFDMKNIVPKDSLTCLVAKATGISMLWNKAYCMAMPIGKDSLHILGYDAPKILFNAKYKKKIGSEGFHQVIDFLNRSHICYALTKKPDVYISFIKQFWRSAEATTDDNGEVQITATIDGHSMSITEASLRRHLKLDDHGNGGEEACNIFDTQLGDF